MSTLLRGQEQVSAKRAMPVNDVNLSATVSTSSSATVQLYYYNAGTRTSDAGQAAGTVVDFTFVHKNILNTLGTNVATKNDTSLAYTCDALTTELEIASSLEIQTLMEGLDNSTISSRASAIGALLKNGEFVIDYRRGFGIGKKATTTATMANVTYNYSTTTTSSSTTAASSSSAGGGNNTYSTEQGDFTATVTDATNNIVLSVDSLAGASLNYNNFAGAILKVYDASATTIKTITLDKPTWTSATKTLGTASCTNAFTFNTGDIVSLTLIGPDKMRDAATDTERIIDQAPINQQVVEETLIDTTNIAAATNYYPSASGVSMIGFKDISVQAMIGGGITVTYEASNDDAASPDWLDISLSAYNMVTNTTGTASWVDTNHFVDFDNLNVKNFRIKCVSADNTNNVQFNIRRKAI